MLQRASRNLSVTRCRLFMLFCCITDHRRSGFIVIHVFIKPDLQSVKFIFLEYFTLFIRLWRKITDPESGVLPVIESQVASTESPVCRVSMCCAFDSLRI
jgi:hypothetical protein